MGKASHRATRPVAGRADGDLALVNRVYSQLRIPGSKDQARWIQRVELELDRDFATKWDDLRASSQSPEFYEMSHRDVQTSMLLSAGLRSDLAKQELLWLLPLLRRDAARQVHPLLVEVGCGSGVTSAIVSLALNTKVVAVDVSAAAVAVTSQVGSRLGADVEAHVGRAEDLATILGGRKADAVFLFSTLRYVQPHKHGGAFSSPRYFEERMASTTPAPAFAAMVDAIDANGSLYYSDVACTDRIAEIEGCLASVGRHVALTDHREITGHVTWREEKHVVFASPAGASAPSGESLFKAIAGSLPPKWDGSSLEGLAAERMRRSLDGLAFLAGHELEYLDGSGVTREELSQGSGYTLLYRAATTGYRELTAYPAKQADQMLAEFTATTSTDAYRVSRIPDPADAW